MKESEIDQIMANVDVSKVWGVGVKTAIKLKKIGINSVLDLKQTNPSKINFYFNVNIERTVVELNQSICFPVITEAPKKNEILSSRSFGKPVKTIEMLSEAITTFYLGLHIKQGNKKCLLVVLLYLLGAALIKIGIITMQTLLECH